MHLLLRAFADELARCGHAGRLHIAGFAFNAAVLALDPRAADRGISHIDERSAGFFALGHAKATGRPAALACTSGTAAAHYAPAVIEAFEARVPMLVLTADRPPELREVGAGQTIDQIKLFGGAVKWFFDVGTHDDDAASGCAGSGRSPAARTGPTVTGRPGPVHLNFALREPLVPPAETDATAPTLGRARRPPVRDAYRPDRAAGARGADGGRRDRRRRRHAASSSPAARSARADLPAPSRRSPRRPAIPCSPTRSAARARGAAADRPLRRAAARRALRRRSAPGARHPRRRPSDVERRCAAGSPRSTRPRSRSTPTAPGRTPPRSSTSRSGSIRAATLTALAAAAVPPADPTTWLERGAPPTRPQPPRSTATLGDELSEPRVAAELGALLPAEALLIVASSMPVRDIETFWPCATTPPRVLANRGANGIDGTLATAYGVAAAGVGPVVALLGDVAFAHDVGGLLAGARLGIPLTIVVVDNGGGGIFDFLPVATQTDVFEQHVATPPGSTSPQAAALAGASYAAGHLGRRAARRHRARRRDDDPPRSHRPRRERRPAPARVDRRRRRRSPSADVQLRSGRATAPRAWRRSRPARPPASDSATTPTPA